MIRVTIKNTGRAGIAPGGHPSLPPPFHLIRLPPGAAEESICTMEQVEAQWPHNSGFKVLDLLRQMVQGGLIQVDIQPYQGNSPVVPAIERVNKILTPPAAVAKPATIAQVFRMDPPTADDDQDEDEPMSPKDDLPDFVDPLYNAPTTKKAKPAPIEEVAPVRSIPAQSPTAIDLPDPTAAAYRGKKKESRKDAFDSAVQMAFIGAGQGGGRIAQSFYDMGYRRVCAVNTTQQDLSSLTIQDQLVIGRNRGGAGKDPEQGKLAAKESYEEIMDLLNRSWGDGVEQMFVCVGAGGGSGTGSWPVLVKAMREFGESTNIEKPIEKHLGIIMTMPKRSEGSRVQQNALTALKQAVELVEEKKISTLVIVDNAKIHDLYPGLPVKQFWTVANQNFAAILHTFNILAAKDSQYNCVDGETEALTQRGWVKGFDLDSKDVLLTKNAETGELEWQAMTDLKLWPEYEGPLIEFKTRTFSAVTTPDHRWLVSNYEGEDVCKLSSELSLHGHDRIHRAGTYRGPNVSPWSDDFVELMGWFLTDGTCLVSPRIREPSQPRISVQLYQSQRANPEKVSRIDALLERLGCCAHRGIWEKDERVTWRLDRAASEILHSVFPERVLTSEVACSLTASQAKRLLETMMLGDGNRAGTDERQQVFTSGSQAGIAAFQMLCVLSGYATTSRWRDMSEYEPKSEKLENVPKMTGVWNATILRRFTTQLQQEHKREFHEKRGVWCPVVPNTYFVARREGTVYVTGNTFDRADYRSVLRNGIMIFGMTRVEEWVNKEDVSVAIRQNLAGSLLADGFDLSKANMAGAIVVAHDDVLEEVPMENIDYAFHSLGRALGNDGITLHSGIYEWNKPGMMVFTIVSGLQPPQARFDELTKLST